MKNSTNQKSTGATGPAPDLKDFPCQDQLILKGDPLIGSYNKDAVITGDPDAVFRPRDWADVVDAIKWCNSNALPFTVCGARTSMTGSSVAESGVLMVTDAFNKVLDISACKRTGEPLAVLEPAVVASDFQRIVEEKGFHYPVVPTSCDNAFVGGTIATNATGEDFYRYGATRNFVKELTIIKADGSEEVLKRPDKEIVPICKGRGGYYLSGGKIDLLIGSEGTLGIIKRAVVSLLPKIPEIFVIVAPFRSHTEALQFIGNVNSTFSHKPRGLEYIDSFSISVMKENPDCFAMPPGTMALVLIKDEVEKTIEDSIGYWLPLLPEWTAENASSAVTKREKEELHKLRHYIPEHIAEIHEKLKKVGGGKLAGDWWVPKDKMVAMLGEFYEASEGFERFTAYGHLGDGHPHTNYLCNNPEELAKAGELITRFAKKAASLGGGVAAEHGIGKIKKKLLGIQYSPEVIAKMAAIKSEWDPKWILGRGNILDQTASSGRGG